MEVERFWLSHQVSATTALYFVNRYGGLVGYLPILYQFLGVTDEDVCHSTSALRPTSHLTFALPIAVSTISNTSADKSELVKTCFPVCRCSRLQHYGTFYAYFMLTAMAGKLVTQSPRVAQ